MSKQFTKHKKTLVLLVLGFFVIFSSYTSLSKEKEKGNYHTLGQLKLFKLMAPMAQGEYFLGSSACQGCHGKDVLQGIANTDAQGNDVNLYDDWQATMMALAAKDPLWRAKLSHEIHTNPSHQSNLENKCTSCHAPMGHYSAVYKGTGPYSIAQLDSDTLGLDGVSCMSCHIQGPDAGTYFSGTIQYDTTRKMYGPFTNPYIGPMQLYTGVIPTYGQHMSTSNACASCHTLITDVVDLSGNYTGGKFIEQATFHEWKNSIYPLDDKNCQSCHMPQIRGPVVIANNILALEPRTPFNLHKFMGGNSFMLQLMKENKAALDIQATDVNFDSTIANTLDMLRTKTLDMSINLVEWLNDTVADFSVKLYNKAGHKFPSGYPSRRAFVQFVATTQEGDTLLQSGLYDASGEVLGHDAVTEPHYQLINANDQVQIYEMVMNDVAGNRTTLLERANTTSKDNRIPPQGFTTSHASYDTVSVIGIGADADFNHDGVEGSGTDEIHYRVTVPGGYLTTNSVHVYAKVFYQTVPPRFVAEMFAVNTAPIDLFKGMYNTADKTPVEVASGELLFVLTPSHVSINEAELGNAIWIGPNPTPEGLIRIGSQMGLKINSIQVFQTNGKLIESFIHLNVNEWEYLLKGAAGQYIIRVNTDKGTFTKKVIKL